MILAKTVKGYGMGSAGEGLNITHQQKKLDDAALKEFRDRFNIPVSDADIAEVPYYRPAEDSEELEYLQERRRALGGYLPQRRRRSPTLAVPGLEAFAPLLESTGEREISTTMALVRILSILLKDKAIGAHVVPIVPDEARTFGMEGLFRQIGIYSSMGQLYTPQDSDQLLYYREDKKGQILEEGINEGGALCSWIAAGTAYCQPRRGHGAVLHLLLDVRLPARRRLHLGGRRHAVARLPDRRHGRAHHARRRGTAAPGRAQPARGHDRAELRRPTTRPTPTSSR